MKYFLCKNFKKLVDAKVHFICYNKIRNPIITKIHKLNKKYCLHVYKMCTNSTFHFFEKDLISFTKCGHRIKAGEEEATRPSVLTVNKLTQIS